MENKALLHAIDARITHLQEFRRLLINSPDMLPLLRDFMSISVPAPEKEVRKVRGEQLPNKRGTFLHQVEESCRNISGHFTVNDAINAFENSGHKFGAKKKNIAMYSALKRLLKKKVVEVSTQGEGSRPSYYRVAQ